MTDRFHVHRFRDLIAFSVEGQDSNGHRSHRTSMRTIYIDQGTAEALAKALADCSRDIATEPRFSESAFQPVDFRGEA